MYNSDAKQDEFVANILKFKKNGIYVDIGSCGSQASNNSFYFDSQLDWRGICVEIEPQYAPSYSSRKNCRLVIGDATTLNYETLFKEQNFSKDVDYLSLDVDTLSFSVLQKLPFHLYDFKVITIEHDYYLYSDTYQKPQREYLQNMGYILLCSNVYVEQSGYYGKMYPFEDWYVNPKYFEKDLLDKIKSESEYPSAIVKKIN
jgi:hypothetical protein